MGRLGGEGIVTPGRLTRQQLLARESRIPRCLDQNPCLGVRRSVLNPGRHILPSRQVSRLPWRASRKRSIAVERGVLHLHKSKRYGSQSDLP